MTRITVYTTDHCGYCRAVKSMLKQHDLSFEEINLERDPQGRERLAQITGMMTFPQVLLDQTPIGGFQETRAALQSGRLAELLAA